MKPLRSALALLALAMPATAQTFQVGKLPAASRDSFEVVYQGQTIGTFVIGLSKAANTFTMTGQAALPAMGVAELDSVTFNATTLAPISMVTRSTMQGQNVVSTTSVADGKATGTAQRAAPAGVQSTPVNATVAAGVIADGAETLLLTTLPLSEAFTTSFQAFDGKTGKTKTYQLSVLGRETISVPAASVETFKVQLTSDETVTYYVTTAEPRKLMLVRLEGQGLEMRRVK